MIKLIATDMDGTLLDPIKRVGKNFESVVKKLNDNNVIFALASGRNYQRIKDKFKNLDLEFMYISDNGNYIEYKGEILNKSILSNADVKSLYRFLSSKKYCKATYSNEKSIYTDDKTIYRIGRLFMYKSEMVDDIEALNEEIIKCSILVLPKYHKELVEELNKRFPHLHIVSSSKHTVDVNYGSMNKGKAIDLLRDRFNLTKNEVMVFGDYLNDSEMMVSCNHSYAVANAHEEIKKIAKYIAPSNRKNGVLATIEKVVLNNE